MSNTRKGVALTHKNLAGLLGKLVQSLSLHLEDLHIEGKKVLPKMISMKQCTKDVSSPLHSFLSGHGTNKESSIHILRSLVSSQTDIQTKPVTLLDRIRGNCAIF